MLKNMAVRYYREGYNCSQSVLMAANEKYSLNLPHKCIKMCEGVSNGLGIGSVCSVLVACIMVISLMCEKEVKMKRLEMIDKFDKVNGGINCGKIRDNDCIKIIENSCDILEDLVKSDIYG
ncbi:MAG: C-GCAxxG-C-C family (seleno)protein [Lachnospirales bacterium]